MADTKTSALPSGAPRALTDMVPLARPGAPAISIQMTVADLLAFLHTGTGPAATDFITQLRKSEFLTNIAALRAWDSPSNAVEVFVNGYYSHGDGGGGQFRWDAANAETDNGGTIIKPTAVVGAGRWIRKSAALMSFDEFGAVGDGDTAKAAANTAAIQAAINWACTKQRTITSSGPEAEYVINAVLDIPAESSHWTIDGNNCVFTQLTNNTPILRFRATGTLSKWQRFLVQQVRFNWETAQGSGNTQAIGIVFDPNGFNNSNGVIGGNFHKLYFNFGHTAIGYANAPNANFLTYWGNKFDTLECGAAMTGRMFDGRCASGSGMPRNSFNHVYMNGAAFTGTMIVLQWQDCLEMDNIEVNNTNGQTMLELDQVMGGDIRGIHAEFGTYTVAGRAVVNTIACHCMRIGVITVRSLVANSGGANYILKESSVSQGPRLLQVGGIFYNSLTATTGSWVLVGNPGGGTQMHVEDFHAIGVQTGVIKSVEKGTGNARFQTEFRCNKGLSRVMGDASLTGGFKDGTNGTTPENVIWDSPLTATRNFDLPTGDLVPPNLEYLVTRTAAALGASALTIDTSLKSLAAGEWARVKLIDSTWEVVAAGSL